MALYKYAICHALLGPDLFCVAKRFSRRAFQIT